MKDNVATELLQRSRRIETRLTQLMIAQGVLTEHQQPAFEAGAIGGFAKITVPTPHTSLKEILACVPETFAGGVIQIFVGSERIAELRR